jgi:hypothetical protein
MLCGILTRMRNLVTLVNGLPKLVVCSPVMGVGRQVNDEEVRYDKTMV